MPARTRTSREIFELCMRECDVLTSKREDMLLDVLPLWRTIDRNVNGKIRKRLRELCDYPLRGRQNVVDETVVEEEVGEQGYWGSCLEDDDIED